MKKPSINMTITKEETGYSAHALVQNRSMVTEADNFEELKKNILEVVNLSFEDKGFVYDTGEIKITLDIESFFDFYKVINARALGKRIGMNQSLLAQYISGIKKPSHAQARKIFNGVQQLGKELSEIKLLL